MAVGIDIEEKRLRIWSAARTKTQKLVEDKAVTSKSTGKVLQLSSMNIYIPTIFEGQDATLFIQVGLLIITEVD